MNETRPSLPSADTADQGSKGVRAVFFDRDGVLIIDKGYLREPEEIRWVAGAQNALARLAAHGYRLFVVSNQSGVARGYFKEEAVRRVHAALQAALPAQAQIAEFAYCPHHPDGSVARYATACDCRKPASGMLKRLIAKHGIDRDASFLIGDRPSDLAAAKGAGVQGFLFTSGNLDQFVTQLLSGHVAG